jgi:hypothetical protein
MLQPRWSTQASPHVTAALLACPGDSPSIVRDDVVEESDGVNIAASACPLAMTANGCDSLSNHR